MLITYVFINTYLDSAPIVLLHNSHMAKWNKTLANTPHFSCDTEDKLFLAIELLFLSVISYNFIYEAKHYRGFFKSPY